VHSKWANLGRLSGSESLYVLFIHLDGSFNKIFSFNTIMSEIIANATCKILFQSYTETEYNFVELRREKYFQKWKWFRL